MLLNKSSAQLTVNATPTPSVCSYSNGKITASASNGTAPYEFFLNGNPFGPGNINYGGLMAGNYTVSVKDANGLTATTNVTVGDIPGPTIQPILSYQHHTPLLNLLLFPF